MSYGSDKDGGSPEGVGGSDSGFGGGDGGGYGSSAANHNALFADANISAPAANTSMSLSAQYGEYGAGRVAGEVAAGVGAGANGYQSSEAQRQEFLDADIAAPLSPVPPVASVFQTIGQVLLGVLGVISGTPQGVIGGAMSINAASKGFGAFGSGIRGGAAGFAGSSAPDLFGGGGGPPNEGYALPSSPVVGYGGAVVNAPASGSMGGSVPLFPGLGYGAVPGFVGGGLQSPAGFASAKQQTSPLPALLLAGLSYFVLS